MADPFEVRMRFTSQLQHLNASVTSAQKAAYYAIKNREMDEDLHSCILEQLERNNMNNRANIMHFIEHLCDLAQRESHLEFVRMMQRDIVRVVDAVAPSDGSGAANVKVVRRVLEGLRTKQLLLPETVDELEECLKDRHVTREHTALGDGDGDGDDSAAKLARANGGGLGLGLGLDKRQIEVRMEEDRERHKRLREGIWAVSGAVDFELHKMWDELSDVGEDDYITAEEDAVSRAQLAEYA